MGAGAYYGMLIRVNGAFVTGAFKAPVTKPPQTAY